MIDSAAVSRLADILVNYSTGVKKGDRVLIQGTDLARPLMEEVYRLVLRQGGHPTVRLDVDALTEVFFREASDAHLDRLDPITEFVFKNSDVLINIRSSHNTRSLTGVDPARQQRWQRTMAPLQSYIMDGRVRWCVTAFPTQAQAQDAGMSLDEY
ncbi:MAG: aminopeptidase, partial [Bacillota bacterium]